MSHPAQRFKTSRLLPFALSKHLSFHARGDDAFVWNGLTGDVAQMSRDVLQLLLAFDPQADPKAVMAEPPEGLEPTMAEEFITTLRARRYLVTAGVEETASLLIGVPYVPRGAVFLRQERPGAPNLIRVWGRNGEVMLDAKTAALFDRCNGERTLGQVLGDAGPSAIVPLLRLARADVAALKILAKPVSKGGLTLQPAAESTMPYPEIADPKAFAAGAAGPGADPGDLRAYHQSHIADAEAQFDEKETTLSHLFRAPHAALKGRTFGAALAAGLLDRGALQRTAGRPAVLLEVGGGLGFVGAAVKEAVAASGKAAGVKSSHLDLSPALQRAQRRRGLKTARGDARLLPVKAGSVDLLIANEMAGDLGTSEQGKSADGSPRMVNDGALQLVREASSALAPGGTLYVSEFGELTADPVRSDHLDHDEWSIRFVDLQDEAKRCGLEAKVVSVPELLGLDGDALALTTTRASYAALRGLFAAHGLDLTKRAWLRTEIEALCAGKLDLKEVHGLLWAPLVERTMGLSPRQFWALIATRPA